MEQKSTCMISFSAPTTLERQVRIASAFYGWSKSEFLRRATMNYLKQQPEQPVNMEEIKQHGYQLPHPEPTG